MKTAVSVPDPLFQRGERMAKRMKIARSELYARALLAYVERFEDRDLTASWNRALAGSEEPLDAGLARAQAGAIADEGW
jgi:predicted transcriptional regulator